MAFIKKNWQKSATDNSVKALMRVTGAGASAFILKKLTEDESTNLKKTIKNISAPAITVLSVLGDLMLEDEKLRALCQGMYTYSFLKAISVIAPSVGTMMGLAGVDEQQIQSVVDSIRLGAITKVASNTASSNELTTAAIPPELQNIDVEKTEEGDTLKKVAEYIEEDADDAIKLGNIKFN